MSFSPCKNLILVDSHTAGEPTRVVIEGAPELSGSMKEKRQELKEKHDWIRTSSILEPRGFEAMVGAVLTEPTNPDSLAGIIFFNNGGYLGMCVHGTIGVVKTLQHLGKITEGTHRFDTPEGPVTAEIHDDGTISVENVESYCYKLDVTVDVPGYGQISGDIAWGGNWFFLVNNAPVTVSLAEIEALTKFCKSTQAALEDQGIFGEDGSPVDHVEIFAEPEEGIGQSKNFVLCSGGEYDRSPCGTGTSAKLACLHAKGLIAEGEEWCQASILNTTFTAKMKLSPTPGRIIPTVAGKAWITAKTEIIVQADDPFSTGITCALDTLGKLTNNTDTAL